MEALGANLGGLLYERELDYLVEHEWAKGAEDVLERRTKHGLHLDEIEKARVADWMKRRQ
jgi:glycerol-3-phosphate dehydrogenase